MSQEILDKLQYKEENNVLIQGLPSSLEKFFLKLTFAKNVTPLLKSKKVDFAMIFAINQHQLNNILREVVPALHPEAKLWVCYPKSSSKIVTDLHRDGCWDGLTTKDFLPVRQVAIDTVWTALRFKKQEQIKKITRQSPIPNNASSGLHTPSAKNGSVLELPAEMNNLFQLNPKAGAFFEKLSFTNRKEYVTWVTGAKKEETKKKRLNLLVDKLTAGKKNPAEK